MKCRNVAADGISRPISAPLGNMNVRTSSRVAIMASTCTHTGARAARASMAVPDTTTTAITT